MSAHGDPRQMTDADAVQLLRDLARVRARRARTAAAYAAEVQRLTDEAAALDRAPAEREAVIVSTLQVYYGLHPPADGRTLDLPGGSLSARKSPDAIDVTDEAAALAWAREWMPEAIRLTPPKPAKEAIDKAALKGDEIAERVERGLVPGVAWKRGVDKFTVETEGDK